MGLMDLSNETELGGPRFFVITSKPLGGIRRLEKLRQKNTKKRQVCSIHITSTSRRRMTAPIVSRSRVSSSSTSRARTTIGVPTTP